MRVGYYGGSFDPPHRAHLAVALAAQGAFALDQVLLAPTGRQPFKPDGAGAPFADRLAMVGLLCNGHAGLCPSELDAPQPNSDPNYTVDALEALRASLPGDATIFAIAGADAFAHVSKWHRSAELFALAEWIVVSRPGFLLGTPESMGLTPAQAARVHLLASVKDPTSATALRGELHAAHTCAEALPEAVCGYIRQHGLYGL